MGGIMEKTPDRFNGLLKRGVFLGNGAMVEWTDFYPLAPGHKVVVRFKGKSKFLDFGDLVEVTGFIGAKGEKDPLTVQYQDSTRRKKYIPMDEVEIHSVEKKTEGKKHKQESVGQKKLRLAQETLRQFHI